MMATPYAVQCRNIVKNFGTGSSQVKALRGIDLDVRQGELMMLVGPSGCGKTTLISIIAGILSKDEGNIHVLNTDYDKLKPTARVDFRGKNIGFIFQSYNLLPALTCAENVAIPLIINHVGRRQAMLKAKELLTELGLGDRTNDYPNHLSGGQQQRVAIARALVHEPGLLVCDEPTSALDHDTGMMIMDLMRRSVEKRGTTLLVVTHDNRIFEYADRIAHMDDGRILDIVQQNKATKTDTHAGAHP
jgi:putative ABC transport system ATP-binding protein